MKKIIALLLTLTFVLLLAGCKAKVPVIGISQYGEHASLDNCREGFLAAFEEAGMEEDVDYKINYQNASFDDSIATQIAQNFAAKNVALMCAIATPAATACYSAAEDKDIPVVFNAISDPEAVELTEGNITGMSDKLPVTAQLQLIRKLQPEAKKIGIVYTTSELNSVSTIAEYEKYAKEYGFTIESVGVTAQSEVTQAVDTLINKGVDCFSNLTDNNVVGVLDSFLEKTNEVKIPVYGSEVEQVKKGCVASAGIDYFELGKKAGEMAIRVLNGEKASDIPYETVSDYSTYVNYNSLSFLGIEVPEEIGTTAIDASK